ncbi:MAG: T9SS type A sorting domain-containing protein [Bacteroidia bacterium]|jgi:hypothetical protein|nr:T9SS type A sorting domain-containing protein [Bacteroidia bacterium]
MFRFFFTLVFFYAIVCNAQLQNSKWYFGANAGLDFVTSPPTVISNTNLNTNGGMSSISDASGNLLFYTDGATIWNSQHQVMANGTGLSGSASALQNVVIAPSGTNSNMFYVFTSAPFSKSIVNMSLAAGLGSVVSKNDVIVTGAIEHVVAGVGCDLVQALTRNQFNHWEIRNGQSLTSVFAYTSSSSSFTTAGSYLDKWLKVAPDGSKWALIAEKPGSGPGYYTVEIRRKFFSLDASMATPLVLTAGTGLGDLFACEFSPDGTKFYVSSPGTKQLYQWDLCAGTNSAIVGSLQTFSTGNTSIYGMQVAPDGKIYCASNPSLSVINSPNLSGAACGFSLQQQSIGAASCGLALPNFCSGFIQNTLAPLSFISQSLSCTSFSFVPVSASSFSSCSASAENIGSVFWNFGDPGSGAANTSTLWSPSHQFSSPGTYTVKMVAKRMCQTDTITQTVLLAGPWPTIALTGNFTICANDSAVITATGADSYTWSTAATGSVLTVSPANSSTYSVIGTNNINGCTQVSTFSVNVLPLPTIGLTGNFIICTSNSAIITATGANSFTWSTAATGSVIALAPVNTSTYSVLGENSNNCRNSTNFTVSVFPCTGLNNITNEGSEVLIYPNPSQGVFKIVLKHSTQITITDSFGRLVYTTSLKEGEHEIDLGPNTNGFYLLTAENDKGRQTIQLATE